ILRTQVSGRPERSAYRHRHARSRRLLTYRRNVNRRGILDADFENIEADRLDAVKEIEGSIGEGRGPNERACAVSHGRFPGADAGDCSPLRAQARKIPA